MYRKYHGFLHVFTSSSPKQTNQKQWYLQCFDKTTCKKKRCFGTIFLIFSARARQVKNQSFFAAFLPPLIWTQEGVKSPKIAKLHLNLTFYLSQSLPQSCNTKNYRRRSGASKCYKIRCFMNVPCILPAKKGTPPPPQLKLTVLVPPERHALLHLRCGRILNHSWCVLIWIRSIVTSPTFTFGVLQRHSQVLEPVSASCFFYVISICSSCPQWDCIVEQFVFLVSLLRHD